MTQTVDKSSSAGAAALSAKAGLSKSMRSATSAVGDAVLKAQPVGQELAIVAQGRRGGVAMSWVEGLSAPRDGLPTWARDMCVVAHRPTK